MTSAEVVISYLERLNKQQESFSYMETLFLPQGALKSVRLGKYYCGFPIYIDTESRLLQVDNICIELSPQTCALLEEQYCSNLALIYSFRGEQ